jgi:site-specific recombinase XerD
MDTMPRPRPPHLHRETTRHRKTVWFVRIGKGPRIRIRGVYGTPEFDAEYRAALAGEAHAPIVGKSTKGTLAWLLSQYRDSAAWGALSLATRRQRENIFHHVLKTAGHEPFTNITGKAIQSGIDRRRKTPSQARHFLNAMRHLFKWALAAEHVQVDPTANKSVANVKGDGFEVWEDEEMARFQERWPYGTRERVAHDVLFYSGLRRGDAVVFGRQHIKNGVARLTTEKTGERVIVPIESELEETLRIGPCGDLSFIAASDGKPLRKESFGNWFRDACRAAGVKKSAHGLRKAGATRDVNRGWTEAELEAKYGWRGGRMASHYTRTMNRERLAIEASKRTATRTSIPAPDGKVRALGEKDQ